MKLDLWGYILNFNIYFPFKVHYFLLIYRRKKGKRREKKLTPYVIEKWVGWIYKSSKHLSLKTHDCFSYEYVHLTYHLWIWWEFNCSVFEGFSVLHHNFAVKQWWSNLAQVRFFWNLYPCNHHLVIKTKRFFIW